MGKTVFVFAGQGAQYPGMGKSLYESSAAARAALDEAERLRPGTLEQCFSGDAAALALTENTQPCLFAVDYACAAALTEAGAAAQAAAGFSLGELAAVAFCGLLPFEEAFALVCERARRMQAAAERRPGAMSAVLRLDAQQVEALCAPYDAVFPVNYNCPGQTVVSGAPEQLARFEADVAAQGGRAMRLKVGGGFHSPFMDEAAEGLAAYLEGLSFAAPRIPLYANATAQPYGDAKALLREQVRRPVLWQRTMEALLAQGYTAFVEVGAGKTLTGFTRKLAPQALACHVEDAASLAQAIAALREAGLC